MNIIKLLLAYTNKMVPAPSEEWELIANQEEAKYLIVHQSGRWYEKILDKNKRPIYICNSEHHRYIIEWEEGKPSIKYKAPNGWKWVRLN